MLSRNTFHPLGALPATSLVLKGMHVVGASNFVITCFLVKVTKKMLMTNTAIEPWHVERYFRIIAVAKHDFMLQYYAVLQTVSGALSFFRNKVSLYIFLWTPAGLLLFPPTSFHTKHNFSGNICPFYWNLSHLNLIPSSANVLCVPCTVVVINRLISKLLSVLQLFQFFCLRNDFVTHHKDICTISKYFSVRAYSPTSVQ